jgi:hypothetical protein
LKQLSEMDLPDEVMKKVKRAMLAGSEIKNLTI